MKVADCSFIYSIFPFVFDPKTFADRIRSIDDAVWTVCGPAGERRSVPVWQNHRFRATDFLSHVSSYLNPQDGMLPTARLWKLSPAMEDVFGFTTAHDWFLRYRNTELPFQFDNARASTFTAHLVLFGAGVAFVTLSARPASEESDDWLDFLHYFRIINGERNANRGRNVFVRAERELGGGPTAAFFPEPAGPPRRADGNRTMDEIFDALLGCGQAADTEPWWKEVFVPGKAISFAALYVDGVPDQEITVRLLYRVRHFLRSKLEILPGAEDRNLAVHPDMLVFAERQWFVFSLEGGAFVACDAPPSETTVFFRSELPRHLRENYYHLFLIALHQRFALMQMSEDVAYHWLGNNVNRGAADREQAFEQIRDALLAFEARGYFTQVIQRDDAHRCYRKWQQTFQVAQLYEEVRGEVTDMHEHLLMKLAQEQRRQAVYESRRSRKMEQRLNQVATLMGVPVLFLTFLCSMGRHPLIVSAEVTLLGFLVGVGFHLVLRRSAARLERPLDVNGESPQRALPPAEDRPRLL